MGTVVAYICGVVGMVMFELVFPAAMTAYQRAREGTRFAIGCGWWVMTIAAMFGATEWWRQNPASDFRTLLAVLSCVALPGVGFLLAMTAAFPSKDANPTP